MATTKKIYVQPHGKIIQQMDTFMFSFEIFLEGLRVVCNISESEYDNYDVTSEIIPWDEIDIMRKKLEKGDIRNDTD